MLDNPVLGKLKSTSSAEKLLRSFDRNSDGALNAKEAAFFAQDQLSMVSHDHAALVDHVFKGKEDQEIAIPIKQAVKADLAAYYEKLLREAPHLQKRFSEHWQEPYGGKLFGRAALMYKLIRRVGAVTQFPLVFINQ